MNRVRRTFAVCLVSLFFAFNFLTSLFPVDLSELGMALVFAVLFYPLWKMKGFLTILLIGSLTEIKDIIILILILPQTLNMNVITDNIEVMFNFIFGIIGVDHIDKEDEITDETLKSIEPYLRLLDPYVYWFCESPLRLLILVIFGFLIITFIILYFVLRKRIKIALQVKGII